MSLNGSLKTKVGKACSCDMQSFFCSPFHYLFSRFETVFFTAYLGTYKKSKSVSMRNFFRLLPWKKILCVPHNSCSVRQEWRKQAGLVSRACAFFRPMGKGNSNNRGHHTPAMPPLQPQTLSRSCNAHAYNNCSRHFQFLPSCTAKE